MASLLAQGPNTLYKFDICALSRSATHPINQSTVQSIASDVWLEIVNLQWHLASRHNLRSDRHSACSVRMELELSVCA